MANDINYQALANEGNPFIEKSSHDHEAGNDETTTDTEYEDGHRDVMIHVVPDTSKGKRSPTIPELTFGLDTTLLFVFLISARWNHIEDLDSFFTRMYYYHQKHGFTIMMLGHLLDLAIYAFVVWFVTSVTYCIDYTVLDG